MANRWFWTGAILLLAGVVFWGVGQAVNPSSGDTEFKKTLESIKQVKSFRGAYSESASSTQHSERLWEVDCNRGIVHQQSRDLQTSSDSPYQMREDQLLVGEQRYGRDSAGSWENLGHIGPLYSGKWYCDNLAKGTMRDLLPDILNFTRHGTFEEGAKKTVNGVSCREWKFDVRTTVSVQKGSVCVGVDDHLPYEMITENGGRYTYSDYNRPIELDVPDAILQSASSTE